VPRETPQLLSGTPGYALQKGPPVSKPPPSRQCVEIEALGDWVSPAMANIEIMSERQFPQQFVEKPARKENASGLRLQTCCMSEGDKMNVD